MSPSAAAVSRAGGPARARAPSMLHRARARAARCASGRAWLDRDGERRSPAAIGRVHAAFDGQASVSQLTLFDRTVEDIEALLAGPGRDLRRWREHGEPPRGVAGARVDRALRGPRGRRGARRAVRGVDLLVRVGDAPIPRARRSGRSMAASDSSLAAFPALRRRAGRRPTYHRLVADGTLPGGLRGRRRGRRRLRWAATRRGGRRRDGAGRLSGRARRPASRGRDGPADPHRSP